MNAIITQVMTGKSVSEWVKQVITDWLTADHIMHIKRLLQVKTV